MSSLKMVNLYIEISIISMILQYKMKNSEYA